MRWIMSNVTNRRGSARASRADAGALAGMNFSLARRGGEVRFGEGAKTSTRGACATQRPKHPPRMNKGEARRRS